MGLVPLVEADGVQIEQVLINLVANAIDAASERPDARGRVIMRVAATRRRSHAPGRGQWQGRGAGAGGQHF